MADPIKYSYDTLPGGGVQPRPSKGVIFQQGFVYRRGMVLAFVSASNGIETLAPVNSAASAPGNQPYAVVADVEVDATTAPQPGAAEFAGEYNADALIFQGTDTVDTFVAAMKNTGLIVKTVVEGRD